MFFALVLVRAGRTLDAAGELASAEAFSGGKG